MGEVSDDEVVVLDLGSELDEGSVMGFVGKDEAAYGYQVVSAKSEVGDVKVVSFVAERRRRRGRLESLREMTMLAVMSEVRRMKLKDSLGRGNIVGFC